MSSLRVGLFGGLSFLAAIAASVLSVQASQAAGEWPWHLRSDSDCPTCLRIVHAWERYGIGHPDIAVVVAEKHIFSDTRSAATWHAGVDTRRFELVLGSDAPVFVDPQPPYSSLSDLRDRQKKGLDLFDSFKKERKETDRRDLADVSEPAEMCSFVRQVGSDGPHNHDLQMASLIAGQFYLGTSGVAPGTHVILTRATPTLDGHDLLMEIITRRPEVRVVSFSQGPGRVRGATAVESVSPHAVHYQTLNKLVMELSIGGMLETRANSATRFLVVASAGNVPAFESNIFEPEEVLDQRIPREAIHLKQPVPVYIDLRPHYLRDVPHLDLPLVVVGAVGPDGTLPSYGRVDQGIDLYAPAGLDWLAQVRATPPGIPSLGGAEWRVCVCAQLARDHLNFETDEAYDRTCKVLQEESDWFQLGVPALDFHTNAFAHDEPFVPLRVHCAERPNSLCTSVADGTSAAAALVSGVAALMFALDPTQSGEEAAAILKSTARRDNPLRLPVVDPGAALDAVVHRIGARLVRAFADSTGLPAVFATPFYYTWFDEPEPFIFTDRARAARFVAQSFTWLGPGTPWHVERLGDARVLRCDVGMAGSTVGIRKILEGQDVCATSGSGVEILRAALDVSDGRRDLVVRVVWRRAGRIGPDTEWRVAGLSVTGELET